MTEWAGWKYEKNDRGSSTENVPYPQSHGLSPPPRGGAQTTMIRAHTMGTCMFFVQTGICKVVVDGVVKGECCILLSVCLLALVPSRRVRVRVCVLPWQVRGVVVGHGAP